MRTRSRFCALVSLLATAVGGVLYPFSLRSEDIQYYSKTNSVTILLAAPETRYTGLGRGLNHLFSQSDGGTTLADVAGVGCRGLDLRHEKIRNKGYIYFALDPTFNEQDISHVAIDVDYFDGSESRLGVFGLQYDATNSTGPNPTYKPLLPVVPLKGSGRWLKTTFHVTDASFRNSQNGKADFRLWASPPELYISRVTVRLNPGKPAAKPLAFDAQGEATLSEWNVQWDKGSRPAFSIRPQQNGTCWLEIKAPGAEFAASWRTSALLEPGEYRFVGRARTQGVNPARGGIRLRLSYRDAGEAISEAPNWTNLTHQFAVSQLEYVELICEFHGIQGTAHFDEASLKLVRISKR